MTLLGISSILFVAGFAENVINGWYIQATAHGRTIQTFLSGTIYVLIWATAWFAAVQRILENPGSFWIIVSYSVGSGLGSMCLVMWSKYRQRKSNEAPSSLRVGDRLEPRL